MKLEGEIGEISLVERLVELGREQFTGAIRFENDGIIKIIYFKTGDILSASTNDRADSIDEILMRANKVSRDHVKQALAKRKETETLGDALLGLGFITKKELTWARRVQAIGVIRSIAAWTTGSFTIVADYLPKREEGTLFPLPQIITELIVTDNDRAKFDAALDGGGAVLKKSADFDESFRRLGLNQEAAAIAGNVDGVNTASEVAMLSGTDTFNVYKLLHALQILGLLTKTEKPQVEDQSWSMPAGGDDFNFNTDAVADAADMWDEPQPEVPVAAPAADPSFETDYAANFDAPALDLSVSSEPSFDTMPESEPEPPEMAPPTPSSMPSWDKPVAPPPITPMPSFETPAKDEQWGFDEAQIETVQKAAVPVRGKDATATKKPLTKPKPAKSGKTMNLIVLLLLVAIIAGGGYAGWMWWENKQAEEQAANVVQRPVKRPALRPMPPVTGTTATIITTTTTAPTTAVAPAATATTASVPPPAPPVTKPAPPPPPVVPATTTARVERPTGGGIVITNAGTAKPAGAVPPASDADRARYEAMAKEFAADKSGNFTVQFELVCEAASITRALREGGTNVWFLPINYRNRSCYRVFWGRYPTQQAAQAATAAIPASLREAAPVVVHIPK